MKIADYYTPRQVEELTLLGFIDDYIIDDTFADVEHMQKWLLETYARHYADRKHGTATVWCRNYEYVKELGFNKALGLAKGRSI